MSFAIYISSVDCNLIKISENHCMANSHISFISIFPFTFRTLKLLLKTFSKLFHEKSCLVNAFEALLETKYDSSSKLLNKTTQNLLQNA